MEQSERITLLPYDLDGLAIACEQYLHNDYARVARQAAARIRELEAKYMELIMAVEKKWPNETRHQTALRYILEREAPSTDMGAKESK